jgi:hypothetical protein
MTIRTGPAATQTDAPIGAMRSQLLRDLSQLDLPPVSFWPRLAEAVRLATQASRVLLYARSRGEEPGQWRPVVGSPMGDTLPPLDKLTPRHVLDRALVDGIAAHGPGGGTSGRLGDLILCPCALAVDSQELLLVLLAARAPDGDASALLSRIAQLSTAPLSYDAQRATARATRDAARLAQVLELTGKLSDSDTFHRAGLAWVNGLAEQFACDTVTLIWRAREGMRLRAISHAERVDRRSEASALAEQVAHEALTQGSEVIWPQPEGSGDQIVAHSHGHYAALVHPGHMITLPMIDMDPDGRDAPLGAVILERQRAPFTSAEQWALRLHCEMAQPTLARLQADTYWLPRRVARAVAPSIPRALRPRTVSGRTLIGTGLAALIAIALIPIPFRLTATAVLKTDAIAYVSAPFDGFMDSSDTSLGDVVTMGAPLFELDRTDLVLERDALLAELAGANREAEIQRAQGDMSEMLIAQSRAEQLTTQILQIDLQLQSAQATAPINGIIVEGEPAKMLGEPVRRGDQILTIAALDGLYIEAALSERDLAFLETGQTATLSLLARPRDGFETGVDRIVPAAQVQDGDNVFPIRMAAPEGDMPDWWLPGMTGVTKIDVGTKPLGWVVTRRLVDYLRLALWV